MLPPPSVDRTWLTCGDLNLSDFKNSRILCTERVLQPNPLSRRRCFFPNVGSTRGVPSRYESSKTMTVTRMATATRLIPVTVDTFDTPTKCESSKTMTVTRIATATLIPVTVDTFDTQI